MPELLFLGNSGNGSFHPGIIKDLSAFFQTSLVSTAISYADLNCSPVCVYYCVDNIVKWFHPGEDFPYWSIELTHLKVPTGSVAAEFLNDGIIYDYGDIQEVEAFEWLNDSRLIKVKWFLSFVLHPLNITRLLVLPGILSYILFKWLGSSFSDIGAYLTRWGHNPE